MNRQLSLSLLMLAPGLIALASPISPEQALARLNNSGALKARALNRPVLAHSTPGAYIFNSATEGYMILSADDAAIPLLGYSDSGSFDPANIPPQMQWWLEQYDRQIEFAGKSQSQPAADKFSFSRSYDPIAPMITTKWDQVAPFNDQCPVYGTARTYTGCVATSMAQVMNYWEYPERGQGSISYTAQTIGKKLSLNFALKSFDWQNMKDSYYDGYTEAQAEAVAYLMKAAAYSVKMDFSVEASGSLALDIANSLVKYFNYDGNANYTLRDYYTSEQWADMLYENLKNVGPVIYGGGSYIGGGHSFILDGCDSNGYFHINWGWSGTSNGYFALDALTPGALGSGGGTGGGYSFTQDAVFGIQPPTGNPVEPKTLNLTQAGNLEAVLSGTTLTFNLASSGDAMWINYNPKTLNISFGVIIEPQGDTSGDVRYERVTASAFSMGAGYGTGPNLFTPALNLADLNLADGTYKLTFASVPVSSDGTAAPGEQWLPVRPTYGNYNYVTLTKDAAGYTVANGQTPQIKISGGVVGELYDGLLSTWSVTVENLSDIEVTSGFAPCLAHETYGAVLLGESIRLTIPPHSSVTREWSTMLYPLQQNFTIDEPTKLGVTFFNENTHTFYSDLFIKEVTIKPTPESAVIVFDKAPQVEGATIKESFAQTLQIVSDPTSMIVTAKPTLKSGYFFSPMICCLCTQGTDGYAKIEAAAGQTILLDTPGQTADFRAELSYPAMDTKTTYLLLMAYEGPQGYMPINNAPIARVRLQDQSAIDELRVSDSAEAEITDLLGRPVKNPTRGIYIVNGRKTLINP